MEIKTLKKVSKVSKVRVYDECDPCMHAKNRAKKKEREAA